MRVRLVIDGATYQYEDLDNLQFDAVQKLLESISACTLFPTGRLDDEWANMETLRGQAMRIKDLEIDNERLDREIVRLSNSRDEIYREKEAAKQLLAAAQTDRHARALEKLLTEKDNEIARRIKALTDAVNANGELTGKIADLIGNVAMAKAENSGLRQETGRMRDELGSRHQIIVDQAAEIRQLRAEIERLQAERRHALAQPYWSPYYGTYPWWYGPPPLPTCSTNSTIEAKQP